MNDGYLGATNVFSHAQICGILFFSISVFSDLIFFISKMITSYDVVKTLWIPFYGLEVNSRCQLDLNIRYSKWFKYNKVYPLCFLHYRFYISFIRYLVSHIFCCSVFYIFICFLVKSEVVLYICHIHRYLSASTLPIAWY